MMELIIGGIIAAVVLIWFVTTWNRLVRLEKNVEQSWANIDVLLKQRYDMIPNLVNTVKGYATHEREIFEQFARARQTAAGALAQGDVAGVAATCLSDVPVTRAPWPPETTSPRRRVKTQTSTRARLKRGRALLQYHTVPTQFSP